MGNARMLSRFRLCSHFVKHIISRVDPFVNTNRHGRSYVVEGECRRGEMIAHTPHTPSDTKLTTNLIPQTPTIEPSDPQRKQEGNGYDKLMVIGRMDSGVING